jgi:hypothetical protein
MPLDREARSWITQKSESDDAIILLFSFILVFNVLFSPSQSQIQLCFAVRQGVKGVQIGPSNRYPSFPLRNGDVATATVVVRNASSVEVFVPRRIIEDT